MKKLLSLFALFLAVSLGHAGTLPTYTPASSIGDTYLYYTYTIASPHDYSITALQMKAYCQNGVALTSGSYSNPSWLTGLAWSKISGTPTTISGYGIMDGVTLTGTQTLTNKSISAGQLTGLGSLALVTPTGTPSSTTFLQYNGTAYSWSTVTAYALPPATSSVLGGVIPSSSYFLVDGSGNLTITALPWGVVTGTPTTLAGYGITDSLITPSNLVSSLSGGSGTLNLSGYSLSLVSSQIPNNAANTSGTAATISGTELVPHGGTGVTSLTAYAPLFGGTSTTAAIQSGTVGTTGQVLMSNGSGALPTFQNSGPSWKWVYLATTLTPGEYVWPDVHSSSVTLTLPSSPPDGTQCVVGDWGGYSPSIAGGTGGFGTHAATVNSPGPDIWTAAGTTSSVVLNQNYQVATFFYSAHYGVWLEFDRVMTSPHLPGNPTIAGGTGAGTSPTVSVAGSDVSGLITVTPGSSPSTAATVATITYNTAYGAAPNAVVLTPANAAAAALSGTTNAFVSASNTGTFVITSGSAALIASTQYKWWYSVPQQ